MVGKVRGCGGGGGGGFRVKSRFPSSRLSGCGSSTPPPTPHLTPQWHCGLATPDHIPHGRGYDTSLNYMDAANDYWTQQYSSCLDAKGNPTLTDLWDTDKPAFGQNNSWRCGQSTQHVHNCTWEDDLLQQRLLATIEAHDPATPLFLFWSAHTVHGASGKPLAAQSAFPRLGLPPLCQSCVSPPPPPHRAVRGAQRGPRALLLHRPRCASVLCGDDLAPRRARACRR